MLLGGLALLTLCVVPASSGDVGPIEQQAFEAIKGFPDALEPIAHAAQFLGVLAIGPVIAVIALIARRPRLTVAALLATVSGHVVLFTGLAWVLTPYLHGRWRGLPWVVVALVAFTRVYLGAHNPLDVIGGFGMGLAIGGVVNLALRVPPTPRRDLRTPSRRARPARARASRTRSTSHRSS